MRFQYVCVIALVMLQLSHAVASEFGSALDLIVKHHDRDSVKLRQTLDTLTSIATKLEEDPNNKKYRRIRLLNKTFWERVGGVNGGISFMTALGFDLVEQGGGQGPSFQVRPGAPRDGDLAVALKVLSSKTSPQVTKDQVEGYNDEDNSESDAAGEPEPPSPGSEEAFNPFATSFSRRSRTHLQQRAEEGLANWARRQAQLQQRFTKIEERNFTILLPLATPPPREKDVIEHGASAGENEEVDGNEELELVMRLWRERHAREDPDRFETQAAKKLRILRATKTYPYVLLRVRLPQGLYLQARFNLDEPLETVYQVIGASLEAEGGGDLSNSTCCHNFELFLAPPTRTLERNSMSLRDAHVLAPACVLHLRWDDEVDGGEHQGTKLEERMRTCTDDSKHHRLPFSARYDVPEPISARRVREMLLAPKHNEPSEGSKPPGESSDNAGSDRQ